MLIDSKNLAFATAVAAGVLWEICTVMVLFFPVFMTHMTAHMMHLDPAEIGMVLSATDFVVGLLGWMVMAGGFGWLMGALYNFMVEKSGKQSE